MPAGPLDSSPGYRAIRGRSVDHGHGPIGGGLLPLSGYEHFTDPLDLESALAAEGVHRAERCPRRRRRDRLQVRQQVQPVAGTGDPGEERTHSVAPIVRGEVENHRAELVVDDRVDGTDVHGERVLQYRPPLV